MTNEQLNRATELRRQIRRLSELLTELKKVEIDDSPARMTGFDICKSTGTGHQVLLVIENSELAFLIYAVENRIAVLEREFDRL